MAHLPIPNIISLGRPPAVATPEPAPRAPEAPPVTVADLAALGFANAAIERLAALQRVGRFIENTDSQITFERLCFMAWLVAHGKVRE